MNESDMFKALSDGQRRDILKMLNGEPLNAGEIAERMDISPAALSYHLKLLKNADLVIESKDKNYVYYKTNASVFEKLILWAEKFADNDGTGVLN